MIIPKAIFLRRSYKLNNVNLEKKARIEFMLISSEIVNSLRSPHVHKLGSCSYFFSKEKFPILASGSFPEIIMDLIFKLEGAGYLCSLITQKDGIVIFVDWRED
ncbi:hypothetical protein [Citrobacter werkmanii]|uniref:hypothetical protein n=1 Tax=Citrobacter werkmanii TaxID=67827 RepID=UPI002F2C050A